MRLVGNHLEVTVQMIVFDTGWTFCSFLLFVFPNPEPLRFMCSLQVLTKGFGFHLRDLCNTTLLEEFVHIADHNVSRLTQEMICKSSSDWLNKAQSHFLSNLDFFKPIRVRGQG